MTASENMAERHGRMLARYAELSLSMAEDVHAAAVASEDPDQKARLATGFQRLGRALRQSLALEARFVRDRARDARDVQSDAADATRAAVRRRQEQVRAAVERQIYCEIEPCDAPAWLADLSERLEEEALYDAFDDETVEDHIARLSADLGLTGETVRDYVPRALRPRFPEPGRAEGYGHEFDDLLGEEDEEDEDEDEHEDDEVPDADVSAETSDDDPACEPPLALPSEAEARTIPKAAPAPEPLSELTAAPEPPPPEPPPPRPPDPEPYIPPWEHQPNGRYPGGSGY